MRGGVEFVNAECSRTVKKQLEQTAAGVLQQLDRGFQLSSLDMSNVPFTMRFLRELRRGLSHNLTLKRLYLNGCQLTCLHAVVVADMLVDNRKIGGKICTLSMENNKLKSLGAIHLSRALLYRKDTMGPGLHRLALSSNQIGPTACKRLSEVLVGTSILRILTLRHNCVDDWGAGWLSLILRNNTSIEVLDVRCNPIGVNGADELRCACVNGQPNLCWVFVMRRPEDMYTRSTGRRRIFVSVPPGADTWLKGKVSKAGNALSSSDTFRASNPKGGKLWPLAENQKPSGRGVKTTVRLVSSRFRWKYRQGYSPGRGSSKDLESHLSRRPASAPLRCTRSHAESVSSLPPRSLGDAGSTASLCVKPVSRPVSSTNRQRPSGSPTHSVQFNLEASNLSLTAHKDCPDLTHARTDPPVSELWNHDQNVTHCPRGHGGAVQSSASAYSHHVRAVELGPISDVASVYLSSNVLMPEPSTDCAEVVDTVSAKQEQPISNTIRPKSPGSRNSDTEVSQGHASALCMSPPIHLAHEAACSFKECAPQDGKRVTVSAQGSSSSAYMSRDDVHQDLLVDGATSDDTRHVLGAEECSANPDELSQTSPIGAPDTMAAVPRHAEALVGIGAECASPEHVFPNVSLVDPPITTDTVRQAECPSSRNAHHSQRASGDVRHPEEGPSDSSRSQGAHEYIAQLSADAALSCLRDQTRKENVTSSDYSDDFVPTDGSAEPGMPDLVDNDLTEAAPQTAVMTSDATTTLATATTTLPSATTTLPSATTTLPSATTTLPSAAATLPSSTATLPSATATSGPTTTTSGAIATTPGATPTTSDATTTTSGANTTTSGAKTPEKATAVRRAPRQRKDFYWGSDLAHQGTPSPLSDRMRAQSVELPLTPLSGGTRREMIQRGISSPRSTSKEIPSWLGGAKAQPSAHGRHTAEDKQPDSAIQLLVTKWDDQVNLPSSTVQVCVDSLLREEEVMLSDVETHSFPATAFEKVLRKLQLADAIEITSELYTLEDMLNTVSDHASSRGRKRTVKRRQHKAFC